MHVPVLTTRLKEKQKKTPWKKTFHKSEKGIQNRKKQLYLDKNRKRAKIIKCQFI